MDERELIVWDVMEEHLSEAAFLWDRWEHSLCSRRYTLDEVTERPERRLLLHLAGLRVGGEPVAEKLLLPALENEEAGLLCTVAFSLLASKKKEYLDVLLGLLTEGSPIQRTSIRRALELSRWPAPSYWLSALSQGDVGERHAAALEVLAFQGSSPGPELERLLAIDLPEVQAAALRASRAALERVERRHVLRGLESPFPEVRWAALEVGLWLGLQEAWARCRAWTSCQEPERGLALQVLASLGGETQFEMLLEALRTPELCQQVLRVLGASGRMSAADACLPLMRQPALARLAGEAFSVVTGLELKDGFSLPEPEPPEELPPLEEDLQTDLLPGPDDELPLPDPEAVERWWNEARPRFERQERYFQGQPLNGANLLQGLQQAPMRRRPALALELAWRSRGKYHVQVRDFTSRQRLQMEQARAWQPAHLLRPLLG
jgi:uncharacterized protein (TIGR02270 family)